MALSGSTNQLNVMFPIVVPNMTNQVTFEGFLARAWMHNNARYLRLANHRPPQAGTQSDGPLMVESDYITIRLDPSVPFDMDRVSLGQRLIARGRVEGHDIPETIGDILRHCNLNVRIPQDIAHLTVSRPAVQIYCTYLEFHRDRAGSDSRYQKNRRPDQQMKHPYPNGHALKGSDPLPKQRRGHRIGNSPERQAGQPHDDRTREFAPSIDPPMMDASPNPKGVQPGQDVSEVADQIDAGKSTKDEQSPTVEEKSIKALQKNPSGKKAIANKASENPETTSNGKKEPKARKTVR